MTQVYKKYEVKIKMVQEQWLQLKMKFYWVITWKVLNTMGGIQIWLGGVYLGGFLVEGMSKFSAKGRGGGGGGGFPLSSLVGKTLNISWLNLIKLLCNKAHQPAQRYKDCVK